MKTLKIGDFVKRKHNPNPVEVVYVVEDIEIFLEKKQVRLSIRPSCEYDLPDGGRIMTNNLLDVKLEEIEVFLWES